MTGEVTDSFARDTPASSPACLANVFSPDRICLDAEITSVKRLLETLSAQLADASSRTLTEDGIFQALASRERLGSTCVGKGVALPHGRIEGLAQPRGAIVRFDSPLEMEAADDQPVTIACGLLVPADSADRHIAILQKLARGFELHDLHRRLIQAQAVEDAYACLTALDAHIG